MTFTFVSNYINHHQIPLCDELFAQLGDDFSFIQTMPMEQERVDMGWNVDEHLIPYVKCLYEEEYECQKIIMESDVVLFGWTGREDIVQRRLQSGKASIRVSERIYREGQWKCVSPRGLLNKYKEHIRYRRQNVCMLCAGAYTASDFHLIGAYPQKMFKWGYFPSFRSYSPSQLEKLKARKPGEGLRIVWAGRFIPLKHPEYVVQLATALKGKDFSFEIHMVGDGELLPEIKKKVADENMESNFVFYGYKAPERVRDIMEICHIHLFTSNYLEGWGAVVNEGMNSGCVEVVNVQTGAAPYLIQHGCNGYVYPDDNYDEMEKLVVNLFTDWENKSRVSKRAYETIAKQWNAGHAATELLRFAQKLQQGQIVPAKEGPLSVAEPVAPRKMYALMIGEKE